MTTEEKLQHFYDVSVNEAKAEAQVQLDAYRQELEQQFDAYKKNKDNETALLLKAESDQASRTINKVLSASQLDIKRSWSKKQNELKDQLFGEVKQLLLDFKETPEYDRYLEAKINEAKEFAENDEAEYYLSPQDAAKASALSASTGVKIQISDHDFMGGIQARIPQKNILIDNSFLGAFENERQNFTFDGGLTYE